MSAKFGKPGIKAMHLKQALYGLKQAACQWWLELCTSIKQLGVTTFPTIPLLSHVRSCPLNYHQHSIKAVCFFTLDLLLFLLLYSGPVTNFHLSYRSPSYLSPSVDSPHLSERSTYRCVSLLSDSLYLSHHHLPLIQFPSSQPFHHVSPLSPLDAQP